MELGCWSAPGCSGGNAVNGRTFVRCCIGFVCLGLSCAERPVPMEERRRWCTPVDAVVTLDDGSTVVLPAPLEPEDLCTCLTEDEASDWEYRTGVVNEMAYDRCVEIVEEAGYDPADSDCAWKRTAFGYGWWALSLAAPSEQFVEGEAAPPCGGGPQHGCGG